MVLAPSPTELQAAAERARAEERHRIATIHNAARKLGVAGSVADDLVVRGTSIDDSRAALIDAAAARDAQAETRPHVRTGGLGAGETRRAAGVVDLAKVASQAWTAGAKVYWDNTAKRVTNVASGNTLVGVAVLAVGSGAEEVIGRVRLNGSF